jgi:beta-aspartyl-peptidase (threonine type)
MAPPGGGRGGRRAAGAQPDPAGADRDAEIQARDDGRAGRRSLRGGAGHSLVDPSYFRTEKRWQQLQRALKEEASGQAHADLETAKHFGTVGAVALDAQGHLAAGTSTGGMTNKRYGRVGDSPIIGAGTWADARCAVSGTGWGEYYIRTAAAHEICARMRYQGQSPEQAGKGVINETIPQMGGDGGAIVLAADGKMATPFNTQGMYRGWIGADGVPMSQFSPTRPCRSPGNNLAYQWVCDNV